eukprot:3732053-Prymnesium_polylepis.1
MCAACVRHTRWSGDTCWPALMGHRPSCVPGAGLAETAIMIGAELSSSFGWLVKRLARRSCELENAAQEHRPRGSLQVTHLSQPHIGQSSPVDGRPQRTSRARDILRARDDEHRAVSSACSPQLSRRGPSNRWRRWGLGSSRRRDERTHSRRVPPTP